MLNWLRHTTLLPRDSFRKQQHFSNWQMISSRVYSHFRFRNQERDTERRTGLRACYLLVSYWRDRASIKTHVRRRSLTRYDQIAKALDNAARLGGELGPTAPMPQALKGDVEAGLS